MGASLERHVRTIGVAIARHGEASGSIVECSVSIRYLIENSLEPARRRPLEPRVDRPGKQTRFRPGDKGGRVRLQPVGINEHIIVGPDDVFPLGFPDCEIRGERFSWRGLEETDERKFARILSEYDIGVV